MNNNPDNIDQDPRDPATRAFDALRNELTDVRQSVESLNTSIQQIRPYDYRKTLGEMLRFQEGVENELKALKSRPAIQYTPESFSREMERERERLAAKDKSELQNAINVFANNSRRLKELSEIAWEASTIRWIYVGIGFAGILFGAVFCFYIVTFIAGLTPESMKLSENIAKNILGRSMKESGFHLIKTGDPHMYDFIQDSTEFMRNNFKTIKNCREEAAKRKKVIECMIVIQ